MNLSPFTLKRLVDELAPHLENALVQDVFLIAPHHLYLDLEDRHLLLSAAPSQSRVVFATPSEQAERVRIPWADRFLLKARITSLTQVPGERILELTLVKKDRLGGRSESRLICELIGRYSNIILTDHKKILGALRQVSGRVNRTRQILPGKPYRPPPALDRIEVSQVTPEMLSQFLSNPDRSPAENLMLHVAGLDLLAAKELLHRSGLATPTPSPTDPTRLLTELQNLFADPPFVRGALGVPRPNGNGQELSVLSLTHIPEDRQRVFPSLCEAIETLVQEEQVYQRQSSQLKEVEKNLQNQLSSLEKKIERIQSDLKETERADEHEKFGNLLMANIPNIPPGADSITLPDLFDPGGPDVTISLNIHKSPVENGQYYLKRVRKARKAAPILERRLEVAKQKWETFQAYLNRFENLGETDLKTFQTELEEAGLIRPKQKQRGRSKQKRRAADVHPRRYRTSDGWLVLVGRNNRENDRLTKSAARQDIFLHAQGCPGSHVILKRGDKQDRPSRHALKEAAGLAAYWSKARGAKRVSVNYTEVRYVHKPRGAPPGLVTIKNEKSLMVEPCEIRRADETEGSPASTSSNTPIGSQI
ncbi:MAG: NFACT family protein [bacterium]|nr:NFACT family protein [bacterium]